MKVKNCTYEVLSVRAFHGEDHMLAISCARGVVEVGDTVDFNAMRPEGKLIIYRGKPDLALMDLVGPTPGPDDVVGGPYPNANTILATVTDAGISLVDWTNVHSRWQGKDAAARDSAEKGLDNGVKTAGAVLGAMATSLSATGPIGALPAGLFSLLGAIVSGLAEQGPKEEPPDIKTITDAMVEVIEEAQQKQYAEQAATLFLEATSWLVDSAKRIPPPGAGGGSSPTPHLERDFRKQLESLVDINQQFHNYMGHCLNHPEIGKFILPALCSGVATYLSVHRLHDMLRKEEGDTIEKFDVMDYQQRVRHAKGGLDRAREALVQYADEKLKADKMLRPPRKPGERPNDSDDAATLRTILYRRQTGEPDLAFVDAMIESLGVMVDGLDDDIAALGRGEPVKHYV